MDFNGTQLVLANVDLSRAGMYKCVVTNRVGEAERTSVITVTGRILEASLYSRMQ